MFCSVAISVLNSSMGSLEYHNANATYGMGLASAHHPPLPSAYRAGSVLRNCGAFVVEALSQGLVVRTGFLAVNVDLAAQQLAGFQQSIGLQVLQHLPKPFSAGEWRAREHGRRRMSAEVRTAART